MLDWLKKLLRTNTRTIEPGRAYDFSNSEGFAPTSKVAGPYTCTFWGKTDEEGDWEFHHIRSTCGEISKCSAPKGFVRVQDVRVYDKILSEHELVTPPQPDYWFPLNHEFSMYHDKPSYFYDRLNG